MSGTNIEKRLVRKLFVNKANNQLSITIPKKALFKFENGKKVEITPKKVRIKIEEFLE